MRETACAVTCYKCTHICFATIVSTDGWFPWHIYMYIYTHQSRHLLHVTVVEVETTSLAGSFGLVAPLFLCEPHPFSTLPPIIGVTPIFKEKDNFIQT